MTKPLTPPDCNLQDFAFMPLDVARLRDSDLAANEEPEACWAAVQLWAASWHQVPAASIPDDDKWMAKTTGYGRAVRDWLKVKQGAMRGWVICDDGRLYHPVVAEKAVEAWNAKLEQRWRTECARIKKHNDRHGTDFPKPDFVDWLSDGCPVGQPLSVPRDKSGSPKVVPSETSSKGQGEGEGQGQGQGEPNSVPSGTDGKPSGQPPPTDETEKAELWRAAVSVLEQGGCPKAQCRTFMGKLVKDFTLPVVKEAVAIAVAEQPADARQYLVATCQSIAGQRVVSGQPESFAERDARIARERWEEMTGQTHPNNLPRGDVIDVSAKPLEIAQ